MSKKTRRQRWQEAITSDKGPDNSTRRWVLFYLSTFADDDGGSCFPGAERLAARTKLSQRCVEGHLRAAVAEGWLHRSERGGEDGGQGWRRYEYTLSIPGKGAESGSARQAKGAAGGSARRAKVRKDVPHDKAEGAESERTNVRNDVPPSNQRDTSNTDTTVDSESTECVEEVDRCGSENTTDSTAHHTSNGASASPDDVVAAMWSAWEESGLGGPGRRKLTKTRRQKLRSLYDEQLRSDPMPFRVFTRALDAIRQDEFWGERPDLQVPESVFKNQERRERWANAGRHPPKRRSNGPGGLDANLGPL